MMFFYVNSKKDLLSKYKPSFKSISAWEIAKNPTFLFVYILCFLEVNLENDFRQELAYISKNI